MNLSFLKNVNAVKNNDVKMNVEFVESVKKYLSKSSKSVELTIKNLDNMLGLRVQILNSGQQLLDCESGVDTAFFDAVLNATNGNIENLQAYDATTHCVDMGGRFKHEVLADFLNTQLPVQVKLLQKQEDSNILETVFQLGYRRKLHIYFSSNDKVAIEQLTKAGLINA